MMMTMTMFIMNHHPLANARSKLSANISPSTRKISPRIATWYIFTIISVIIYIIIIMVIMITMIRLDSTWERLARDLAMFAFFTAAASSLTRLALGYYHDDDDSDDNDDNEDNNDNDNDDDGSSPGLPHIQPVLHWSIIIICCANDNVMLMLMLMIMMTMMVRIVMPTSIDILYSTNLRYIKR